MTWFRFVLIVLVIVVAAGGCAAERVSDPAAPAVFRPATALDVSATEYRVAPPDKLALRAPGVKEVDGLVTQIRPDGKVSVNLVGELFVAGLTPQEINAMLTAAVGRYYNNVAVTVEVAEYNSKFYEVFGTAVHQPGRKPYTGRNTVVAALCGAGFTEDAWPQQVSVSRPGKDGQTHTSVIVDMKRVYMYGDTTQNYLLEEGDIIYVPDGPLVAFEKNTRKLLGPFTGISGAAQSAAPAKP